jgi:hypothetical protein
MGTSKGDKSVYAVVGFPVPFGKGGTRVDYYVTRLAWAARSVRRMKPQPRIFF